MPTHKPYNGWFNYETWVIRLWIDNDQGDQEYWQEQADEILKASRAEHGLTKEEVAQNTLATVLKEFYDENAPEVTGVYADLLNAGLSEVEWYEVAKSFYENPPRRARGRAPRSRAPRSRGRFGGRVVLMKPRR